MEKVKNFIKIYLNSPWIPFLCSLSLIGVALVAALLPSRLHMYLIRVVMISFIISTFGLPVAGIYQLVKKQYSKALGSFALFILIYVTIFLFFVSNPFPAQH